MIMISGLVKTDYLFQRSKEKQSAPARHTSLCIRQAMPCHSRCRQRERGTVIDGRKIAQGLPRRHRRRHLRCLSTLAVLRAVCAGGRENLLPAHGQTGGGGGKYVPSPLRLPSLRVVMLVSRLSTVVPELHLREQASERYFEVARQHWRVFRGVDISLVHLRVHNLGVQSRHLVDRIEDESFGL